MPDIFSDERKKLKTHKHTHTHTHTHTYIYIQTKKKELPVNLKPQNSPRYTLTQKTVSETQNHSNTHPQTHSRKEGQRPLYKPAWPAPVSSKIDPSRLASKTRLLFSSNSHTNFRVLPVRDVTRTLSPSIISDCYDIWVTPPSARAHPR